MFVSKRYDFDTAAVMDNDVAYDVRYLYWEKQALVEALESWLRSKESWGWLRTS